VTTESPGLDEQTTNTACRCLGWARVDGRMTNHHPDCENFEELRYVKVSCGGGSYVIPLSDIQNISHEFEDDDTELALTVVKMTREEYDRLPEFSGF